METEPLTATREGKAGADVPAKAIQFNSRFRSSQKGVATTVTGEW